MTTLVTHQFDAKYHQQNVNTIIELDPNRLYANPRLVDLRTDSNTNNYNYTAGAFALIKNIKFMDGNVEIDSLLDANQIIRFKNLLTENRKSKSLNHLLNRSALGYDLQFNTGYITAYLNSPFKMNQSAYLTLSSVMGFFEANRVFQFKNPRLVIEWDTDIVNTGAAPRPNAHPNILAPSLIVDEILDPRVKAPEVYVYKSLENDRVTLPETTDANPTVSKQRLNGFNKKLCGRGLIRIEPTTDGFPYDGRIASQVQNKEVYQLYMDNQPVFPSAETRVSKQHRVNALWGSMNSLYQQYLPKLVTQFTANAANPMDPFVFSRMQGMDELQSYGAVDFSQERFNDLQVEYSRTRAGAVNLPAVYFVLTVEVWKRCQKDSDGDAVVSYA